MARDDRSTYPFSAIVGQDALRTALLINAVDPRVGGVLIRGQKGTAKSTAVRALRWVLPEIEVVEGCRFGCDPSNIPDLCPECRERAAEGLLPRERRRPRLVDLPVSATEDRVVGTIDLEQALKHGERRFEAGLLAEANRGLLYVDEVNLLDDHVVDLLLDSAAMGVNTVEREGVSFSHPARFILVGTMNPEEGDLRPQLLDRFSLCVDIEGIADRESRVQIVERRVAYEQDPEAFYESWRPREEALSRRITEARCLLPSVTYTRIDLYAIAALTSELQVDGHRADIVILKAALAQAAFDGRMAISEADILLAAELALPHRFKRKPFDNGHSQLDALSQRLEEARARADDHPPQADEAGDAQKKKRAAPRVS